MRTKIQNDIKVCELKEKEFKESIEKKWNVQLNKLALDYRFDYIVIKNYKPIAFLEIKKRNFKTTDFYDSMINLNKWMKAKELRDSTGLPTLLACRYIDKDVYCKLEMKILDEGYCVRFGARTKNTRDWQDIQPAVHIPMRHFKEIVYK